MNATVTLTATLEIFTCPVCGIHYGVPPNYARQRRMDGKDWHCPNGHQLTFGKSELEIVREELQRERQALDQEKARVRDLKEQRDRVQESLAKEKESAKRLKRRIGNGVCPCCKRSFDNLKRHMATKHPELLECRTPGGKPCPPG
jgi:hypothetical protein